MDRRPRKKLRPYLVDQEKHRSDILKDIHTRYQQINNTVPVHTCNESSTSLFDRLVEACRHDHPFNRFPSDCKDILTNENYPKYDVQRDDWLNDCTTKDALRYLREDIYSYILNGKNEYTFPVYCSGNRYRHIRYTILTELQRLGVKAKQKRIPDTEFYKLIFIDYDIDKLTKCMTNDDNSDCTEHNPSRTLEHYKPVMIELINLCEQQRFDQFPSDIYDIVRYYKHPKKRKYVSNFVRDYSIQQLRRSIYEAMQESPMWDSVTRIDEFDNEHYDKLASIIDELKCNGLNVTLKVHDHINREYAITRIVFNDAL